MLIIIFTDKHTTTHTVSYSRVKLSELSVSETNSVVVGESSPPSRRMLLLSPGRLQHRWFILLCLSVREGRGEISVPVIFRQDCDDDEYQPPHRRLEQELCLYLSPGRSCTVHELPLTGLNTSALLMAPSPPVMRTPAVIKKCQMRLNKDIIKYWEYLLGIRGVTY